MAEKKKYRRLCVENFAELNRDLESGKMSREEYDKLFTEARKHGLMNTPEGKVLGPITPFCIGGSDLAAIEGTSPYKTKRGLQREKLGLKKERVDDSKQFIFDYGHEFEDAVGKMNVNMLGKKLGRNLVYVPCNYGYINEEWPHFLAHPDGTIQDRNDPNFIILGEVKTTSTWTPKWKDYYSAGIVPPEYMSQIQAYMKVLGLKEAYLLAYGGTRSENSFVQIKVELDEEYAQKILDAAEEFVNDTIAGIMYDASDCENEAVLAKELQEMFPEEDEKADFIKLPRKFDEAFDAVGELLDEMETLSKEVKAVEADYKAKTKDQRSRIEKIKKELIKCGAAITEEIGSQRGGFYTADDGTEWKVSVKRGYSLDSSVKAYAEATWPEAWKDITSFKPKPLEPEFSRVKPEVSNETKTVS